MAKNNLLRLQNWYKSHCNGDWEHSFGISIVTLDNPGWDIEIELNETCLENKTINISSDNGEDDWYFVKTENQKFIGAGDFDKLNKILSIFFDFLELNRNDDFVYTIYTLMENQNNKIWRPVYASMIRENLFKIVDIKNIEDVKKIIQFENIEDVSEINFKTLKNRKDYFVGDVVECELKRFFNGVGLIVKRKTPDSTFS